MQNIRKEERKGKERKREKKKHTCKLYPPFKAAGLNFVAAAGWFVEAAKMEFVPTVT